MSPLKSIRNILTPVRREGYPFIVAFAVAAIVLGFFADWLFWIGAILTAWCAYFFRDPPRITPIDADLVVSPADGRVSAVTRIVPPDELDLGDEPVLRISVFMSVFDCHVNRAPLAGRVARISYSEGAFLNAESDKASEENERNAIVMETVHGEIGVVQIAGLVARRILCWTDEGRSLEAGERFGLIRFGSRLDVYLPGNAVPRVAVGQTAISGETVLAAYNAAKGPVVTRRS